MRCGFCRLMVLFGVQIDLCRWSAGAWIDGCAGAAGYIRPSPEDEMGLTDELSLRARR
jgi:hypothetical protein